jgi:hypothetical protein
LTDHPIDHVGDPAALVCHPFVVRDDGAGAAVFMAPCSRHGGIHVVASVPADEWQVTLGTPAHSVVGRCLPPSPPLALVVRGGDRVASEKASAGFVRHVSRRARSCEGKWRRGRESCELRDDRGETLRRGGGHDDQSRA